MPSDAPWMSVEGKKSARNRRVDGTRWHITRVDTSRHQRPRMIPGFLAGNLAFLGFSVNLFLDHLDWSDNSLVLYIFWKYDGFLSSFYSYNLNKNRNRGEVRSCDHNHILPKRVWWLAEKNARWNNHPTQFNKADICTLMHHIYVKIKRKNIWSSTAVVLIRRLSEEAPPALVMVLCKSNSIKCKSSVPRIFAGPLRFCLISFTGFVSNLLFLSAHLLSVLHLKTILKSYSNIAGLVGQ